MSRLSRLMGKPVEVEIGGEVLEIHPLNLKELPFLMKMNDSDPEKQASAMAVVLRKTLMKSVPDATEEEIEGIALTHFTKLVEAIVKVNGLDDKGQSSKAQLEK